MAPAGVPNRPDWDLLAGALRCCRCLKTQEEEEEEEGLFKADAVNEEDPELGG